MVVQPNLEICPRRKVCMPAFGRNTTVAIAAGRLRARVEESEVGFIQRVDSTRIRMDVVDDFDRHVERTSELSSIERPWEVHAHDPAVDHRAGDAKAGTVDLHLIQETFDQIQEGATTRGWICPETDRLRAIRFEKRKPSLRAADVTCEDQGQMAWAAGERSATRALVIDARPGRARRMVATRTIEPSAAAAPPIASTK